MDVLFGKGDWVMPVWMLLSRRWTKTACVSLVFVVAAAGGADALSAGTLYGSDGYGLTELLPTGTNDFDPNSFVRWTHGSSGTTWGFNDFVFSPDGTL